jgi:hypothetical chaperone protein
MMANVKQHADSASGEVHRRRRHRRPINFQGAGGDEENRNALEMLVESALEAGFKRVAFLYEPMAAAMEYEARLDHEECVLVLDIGGGTTDCSFVRVGPTRRASIERDADILGHAGERIGGNDYDQLLALRAVMGLLGYEDELLSGATDTQYLFRRCRVDQRRQRSATLLLAAHAGAARSSRRRGAIPRSHRPTESGADANG